MTPALATVTRLPRPEPEPPVESPPVNRRDLSKALGLVAVSLALALCLVGAGYALSAPWDRPAAVVEAPAPTVAPAAPPASPATTAPERATISVPPPTTTTTAVASSMPTNCAASGPPIPCPFPGARVVPL